MIQQLHITYTNYRWHRITTAIILLLCVVLLYKLADGFPPRVWLFLVQVLPTLPILWQMRGIALFPPLIGLLLISFSFFLLWSLLISLLIRTALHWWHAYQEQRCLDQEIAELQAQEAVNQSSGDAEAYANEWLYGNSNPATHHAPYPHALDNASMGHAIPADPYENAYHNHAMQPPVNHLEDDDDVQMFHLASEQTISGGPPIAAGRSTSAVTLQTLVTQLRVAAISDPGVVRKQKPNEDNILAVHAQYTPDMEPPLLGVFAVADGMGGHHNGQEASRIAIESLRSVLLPALSALSGEHREEKRCADLLQQSVHRANHAVYQRQREQQKMMGTTITTALVFGMTAYIVNVGDSRTYLYRASDGLRQVTRDHSLVADLVHEGAISREEMYSHPRRNEIYRCLGDGPTVELDTFKVLLQEGDILLLCSDGLWEMVHDEDIEQIIENAAPHASQLSTQLMQAALNRGGLDNVSVVTVCVARNPVP